MSKRYCLLYALIGCLSLSCTTASWISKIGTEDIAHFPLVSYEKVLYYQHTLSDPENLAANSNTQLVDSLWVPKKMAGEKLATFEQYGWEEKAALSKKEIKKLRKLFSDQGRNYYFKECDPYAFNRCMVFVSNDSTIVGNIYFCQQGYMLEAFPTLRPEISNNFMWSEAGMEDFEKFLLKIEAKY